MRRCEQVLLLAIASTPCGCGGSSSGGESVGRVERGCGHVVQIEAGYPSFSCAVTDQGGVDCWGDAEWGQTDPPSSPLANIALATGAGCGVRSDDGTLACWGRLNGTALPDPPAGAFTVVAGENDHLCGVTEAGKVRCWGSAAVNTPWPEDTYEFVAVGAHFACALRGGGVATCVAFNAAPGQVVPQPTGTFTTLDAGNQHVCGLRDDGSIECFGQESYMLTDVPQGVFRHVSVGSSNACAIRDDGSLVWWGRTPTHFGEDEVPVGKYTTCSFALSHGCALGVDGALACWGQDASGEVQIPPCWTQQSL